MEACKALVNEIEILKELAHPNLIKIYDTYQDTTDVYIVEERFHGRELFDVIANRSKLDQYEIMQIMHHVISALTYCHY